MKTFKAMIVMSLCLLTLGNAISKGSNYSINTHIDANGSKHFSLSGKNSRHISIKKTSGIALNYIIKQGNKTLSKGNTNQNIRINSDGKSTYKLILKNPTAKPQKQVLSVVASGGSNDI